MTIPMQDATDLLALEEKSNAAEHDAEIHRMTSCPRCLAERELREELRNRAPAVIRALMERVRDLEGQTKGQFLRNEELQGRLDRLAEEMASQYQARIKALEAERDIWRGRAQDENVFQRPGLLTPASGGPPWPDPTPAEIAAAVAAVEGTK